MARLYFSLVVIIFLYIVGFVFTYQGFLIPKHQTTVEAEVKRIYVAAKVFLDEAHGQMGEDFLYSIEEKNRAESILPMVFKNAHDWGLAGDQLDTLLRDELLVADLDNEEIFIPIKGSSLVAKIGPVNYTDGYKSLENKIDIIGNTGFFLTILIWVWMLHRRMSMLHNAASSFGAGDFDARVPDNAWVRLGKLNSTFNAMAERIQKLILGHKQLVNSVSHELRSPVARIRLELEMLEQVSTTDKQLKYIKGIDEDLSELDELIDELLSFARLEREGYVLDRSDINVSDEVRALIDQVEIETDKVVRHKIQPGLSAVIDKKLIIRALSNLLRNAFKYADKEVVVTICEGRGCGEFDVEPESGITIVIEDDGEGISPEDRTRIFEPFVRLDPSRTRETGGYGLGLAIVKQIIDVHRGRIEVSQSQSGGAKFTISLPH